MFIPKNILVTGGAGFIGSHFVRYLLNKEPDVQVVNLDLLTYAGSKGNLTGLSSPDRHHLIEGDICDSVLVEKILNKYKIDAIVHFAAESHVDRSIIGPSTFIETNVKGTFVLLEEAKKFWCQLQRKSAHSYRFHHISTDEVYGTLGMNDPPFSEKTPYAPNSPYSASKAASDHLVRAYHHTFGLATTTTNCSNNYGPFQHPEKLIPTVIRSCLEGRSIPVYGDGTNIRDWLYVVDHCSAIWNVIQNGRIGETYNVGGDNNLSNLEIIDKICETLGGILNKPKAQFTDLIQFVPDRLGHDWRYAVEFSKIHDELGWLPVESFHSGISKTVSWYLKDLDARRFPMTYS